MGKLTGTEGALVGLSGLVLLACTILAFLLGYVTQKDVTPEETGKYPSEDKEAIDPTAKSHQYEEEYGDNESKEDQTEEVVEEEAVSTECPPCAVSEGCPAVVRPEVQFTKKQLVLTTPKNNHVVAIIVPIYMEDKSNYMFVCTGVAISFDQVLTGSCGGDEDIMDMYVRAGSQYWHTGGTKHKIISVSQPRFKYSGLYVLEVSPPFSSSVQIASLAALGEKWTEASVMGWKRDLKKPTRTVQLDTTEQVIKYSELTCDGSECQNAARCDDTDVGQALVIPGSPPKLLGIVSGRGCLKNTNLGLDNQHRFTDMTSSIYGRWLQEVKHSNFRRSFLRYV